MAQIIKTAILSLCLIAPSHGRARVQGWCESGNKTITVQGYASSASTPVQRSHPSCTVTVYLAGTLTLASIYSDNSGTPLANPFTATSLGTWFFYASDGRYDAQLSSAGIPTPFTLGDWNPIGYRVQTGTGAVNRDYGDKLYENVSVKDFGAIGNGVADDTASIQGALNSVSPGGSVYVPPGNYRISAPLTLSTALTIYGANEAGTIITNYGNSNALQASGSRNITIRDLEIFDGIVSTRTTGDAIHLTNPGSAVEVQISRVQIGGHFDGVHLENLLKSSIKDTRVTSCKNDGFSLYGGSTSTVFQSTYSDSCGRDGYHQEASSYIGYYGTASDLSGRDGYRLEDTLGSDNSVLFASAGAESNAESGFRVQGTGYINGVSFQAVHATGSHGDGVYLKGVTNVSMSGGLWCGNAGYGLNISTLVAEVWFFSVGLSAPSCANTAGAFNDPNNALAARFYHPVSLNQDPSLGTPTLPLAVRGNANQFAERINGSATSGQSYGLDIQAGTNSSDQGFLVRDSTGTNVFLQVLGSGSTFIKGNPGTGVSNGPTIEAGTNSSDTALGVFSASHSAYFIVRGDGLSQFYGPVVPQRVAFAALGLAPTAGTFIYCTDCATAATCAGSGTGHMAVSSGLIWTCQ